MTGAGKDGYIAFIIPYQELLGNYDLHAGGP